MPNPASPPADVLALLKELGAEEIGHHAGRSLMQHLCATYRLLGEWGAPEPLALAGLCHSVFSTSEFGDARLDPGNRDRVRAVIGSQAERLAFLFCAMDRQAFLATLGQDVIVNRFEGESLAIEPHETRACCEVLLANELDLAIAKKGADRPDKIAKKVGPCFALIEAYVSDAAKQAYRAATHGVIEA